MANGQDILTRRMTGLLNAAVNGFGPALVKMKEMAIEADKGPVGHFSLEATGTATINGKNHEFSVEITLDPQERGKYPEQTHELEMGEVAN